MRKEHNLPAVPDEHGAYSIQTLDEPQEFCLILPSSWNDILKPSPLTARQQLKHKFRQFRDKYYAQKLAGTSGKLACGVTWRLDEHPPFDITRCGLVLRFNDPRCKGVVSYASHFADCDFEERYLEQLKEHARLMELRNLAPAAQGDPDGFFVKWAG